MTVINIVPNNIQNVQGMQWLTVTTPPPSPVIQSSLSLGVADIKAAIADDPNNATGSTPADPPDHFAMLDATVGVSLITPGDVFKGLDPSITNQFINLTPDTLGISAITPNTFIKTDVGNDVISVTGGRNVLMAGAGANTLIGGTPGTDTFISDVETGNVITSIRNFHNTDNAAITGLTPADFNYTLKDTTDGLELDALPTVAGKNAAQLILQGFTTADLNVKVVIGFGNTGPTVQDAAGTPFLFVHAI